MPAQVATGHNNAAGLASVTPQPAMSGLLYPRLTFGGDQSVNRDGFPLTRWAYGFLTPAQKSALDSLLGLSEAVKSAAVTIQTLTNDFATYANYNAHAVYPEPETDYHYFGGRFVDVVYTFHGLEAL